MPQQTMKFFFYIMGSWLNNGVPKRGRFSPLFVFFSRGGVFFWLFFPPFCERLGGKKVPRLTLFAPTEDAPFRKGEEIGNEINKNNPRVLLAL